MADVQTPQGQGGDSGVVTPPPPPQANAPAPGDPAPKPQAPDTSASLTPDEFNKRLRDAYEYGEHPDGQKLANDPNPPSGIRAWFHQNFMDRSAGDVLKAEGAGIVEGLARGASRLTGTVASLTGTQNGLASPDELRADTRQIFGLRQDDAVANGISDIVSWVPTMLAAHIAGAGALGEAALTGFTEPLEQAKAIAANNPRLGWMRLLASNPNDPAILQRAENAARFVGMAKMFHVVASGLRLAAGKLAPAEAKTAAETLQKFVDHEPVTPQDHLVPKPQGDGSYKLELNPESPVKQNPPPEAPKVPPASNVSNVDLSKIPGVKVNEDGSHTVIGFRGVQGARHPLEPGVGGSTFISPDEQVATDYATNGGREPNGTVSKMETTLKSPMVLGGFNEDPYWQSHDIEDAIKEAKAAGHDGLIIEKGHGGHPEFSAFDQNQVTIHEPPVFSDRAEAEAVAQQMNTVLDAKHASGPVSAEAAAQFSSDFRASMAAPTPDNVENMAQHFNINYFNEDKETLATLDATAKQIQTELTAAQARGTPVADTIRQMANYLGSDLGDETAARVGDDLQNNTAGLSAKLLAGDFMLKKMGNDIGQAGLALTNRLHDPIAVDNMRSMLGKYFLLSQQVAGANSEVGRGLNILRYRDAARLAMQSGDVEGSINAARLAEGAGIPGAGQVINVQKMSPQQIAGIARMFNYSDGSPRYSTAVTQAAKIMGKGEKFLRGALEYFVNNLLSHPKILVVKAASDFSNNLLANGSKVVGGLLTSSDGKLGGLYPNTALAREGVDGMIGNFKYLEENLRGFAAALRSGQSVITPRPTQNIIGGVTGDIVRTPSRAIMGVDEFAKATNYRAWVYSNSMRAGRAAGLDGDALDRFVQTDMQNAFDPNSGEAVIPRGIRFAEDNTFQTPIDPNSVMGGFHNFVQNHIEAKFIAPFTKISTNIFENVWQSTPALNLFNARARAIMAQGGEEAAMLHGRSLMAGTFYGWAYYHALMGNLTGQGPTDPHLRQQWSQSHQPYSMKLPDGQWLSYKRLEPIGSYLGLIADLHDIHASWQYDRDPKNASYAVVGAIGSNLASKTFMLGLTNFADAFASKGDPNGVRRYIQQFAANAVVPGVVSDVNPDPHYREVESLLDAIKSRTPGLSQTLPPNFNMYGEPVMRVGGEVQRALNPFPFDARNDGPDLGGGKSLSEKLLETEKAIGPLATSMMGKHIDLLTHDYAKGADPAVAGKTPWERWNELIAHPEDGDNLRDALTEFVRSGSFDELSKGTHEYPGGAAQRQVNKIVNAHRNAALKQLREEYPALDAAIRFQQARRAAAYREGAEGVQQVQADSADFGS